METTVYRPSMTSRALDVEDDRNDPQAMPYHLARADQTDLSPHDPMPLFLSDPESAPDPQEFSPRSVRPRAGLATQIVASVLAASAIAVLCVLFQADVSRLLQINTGAWVSSVMANQPATPPVNSPPVRQIPLKDPARVANPMQLASADTKEVAAPAAPSREAIANAYQTALQTQTPSPAPIPAAAPPPPSAPAPAKTLDADTLAGLMTRAKSLIAIGDISAARLLLERAANAQDATAAFMLGQTFDPAVLGTKDTRSITADPAAARDWYQKAAQLGSAEARQRLTQLQN